MIRYETPNAETIAAIEEVRKLKADPSLGKDLFRCRSDDGGAACR